MVSGWRRLQLDRQPLTEKPPPGVGTQHEAQQRNSNAGI